MSEQTNNPTAEEKKTAEMTGQNVKNSDSKKGKGKGKGKGNRQNDGKGDKKPGKFRNDLSTWVPAGNEPLAIAAASIPFTYANGTNVRVLNKNNPFPGVMRIKYAPTFGVSNSTTSAINTSAISYYTYVRHMNSGATNRYHAPDLMLAMCAFGEALTWISVGRRAYGLVMQADLRNKYVPRALVEACGFDYQSLSTNLANFRALLDMYTSRLAAFAMPRDFNLYVRRLALASFVFKDNKSSKSQFYAFTPESYLVYDQTAYPTGGALVAKAVAPRLTVDDYFAILADIIDTLRSSQDFATMSGDILKAYGEEKIVRLASMPSDYTTPIIEEVTYLEQIMNSVAFPDLALQSLDVTQRDNIIIAQPKVAGFFLKGRSPRLFNTYNKDADWKTILEGTRLTTFLDRDDAMVSETVDVLCCGTEIVRTFVVYVYKEDGSLAQVACRVPQATTDPEFQESLDWPSDVYGGLDYASTSGDINFTQMLYGFAPFNYHPTLYAWNGSLDSDGGGATFGGVMCEVDNYTSLEAEQVSKIHDVALLGVFNCPVIARADNIHNSKNK